jgi:hypothetical protein
MEDLAHATIPEKLMSVARQLGEHGQSFSAEDLLVAAWKEFPATLGLKGFEMQYPDSHKMVCVLTAGKKGMVGRGLLDQIEPGKYALPTNSRNGQMETRRQASSPVARMLRSHAFQLWSEGKIQLATFTDACKFWGITSRNVCGAFTDTEIMIESAKVTGDKIELCDGTELTTAEANALTTIHGTLKKKFPEHLALLRKLSSSLPATAQRG